MSRTHGKNSRVLVNSAHLSGDLHGWTFRHARAYADTSNLLSDGEQYFPGLLSGLVSLAGDFNSGAGNITAVIDTAAAADAGLLTTVCPEGLTVGTFAFLAEGNVSARETPAAVKDAVRLNVEGTPNDGVDWGVLLHGLTAETADGNGTSVDNAAGTTRGGRANLHVTAFSGLTSIVVKIQHSTDNAVWNDLITFTTVTGTTWERQSVSGTVNRYVRAWWDVTGTGSCTFALAFARR